MPRRVTFSEFGPASVLTVSETPVPDVGPGQVRVRVRAAGVNPFDYKLRRGAFAQVIPPSFPHKIGNEFSGAVDHVGDDVTTFRPGDDVLGFTTAAAYADYVVVPVDQVTAKPINVTWEVAGALSVAGQTAYYTLQDLEVREGETVVIHGASGGVGTIAVQLARAAGATVIGSASPRNHDHLRSLGAVPIDYNERLVSTIQALSPNGVDAVLDLAGGTAIEDSLALVADRTRIGTVADEEAATKYQVRRLQPSRSAESLDELARMVSRGDLRVPISVTYPLKEAAAAHRDLESRHRPGKIVLLT
jgi:enoyl reductase